MPIKRNYTVILLFITVDSTQNCKTDVFCHVSWNNLDIRNVSKYKKSIGRERDPLPFVLYNIRTARAIDEYVHGDREKSVASVLSFGVCGIVLTGNGRNTFISTIAYKNVRNGFLLKTKHDWTKTAFNGRDHVLGLKTSVEFSSRGR